MAGPFSGRCLCGAVRFQVEGPPLLARACWCRDCQYLSSGNASISVVFASGGLVVAGATAEHVGMADSGNVMRRRFCPACGTPLFSEATGQPGFVAVRAGALDDRSIARPGSVIWMDSAPGWAHVDPALPRSGRHVEAVPGACR